MNSFTVAAVLTHFVPSLPSSMAHGRHHRLLLHSDPQHGPALHGFPESAQQAPELMSIKAATSWPHAGHFILCEPAIFFFYSDRIHLPSDSKKFKLHENLKLSKCIIQWFLVFTHVCNHHHRLIPEHFIIPERNPVPVLPVSSSWQPLIYFLSP